MAIGATDNAWFNLYRFTMMLPAKHQPFPIRWHITQERFDAANEVMAQNNIILEYQHI